MRNDAQDGDPGCVMKEFVFQPSEFPSYGPVLSEYVEPPSLSKMIIRIIRIIPQLYLVPILL